MFQDTTLHYVDFGSLVSNWVGWRGFTEQRLSRKAKLYSQHKQEPTNSIETSKPVENNFFQSEGISWHPSKSRTLDN